MKQKKGYSGAKSRFMNRIKTIALIVLTLTGVACFFYNSESTTALALALPAITLVKKGSGLSDEEEMLLKKFEDAINKGMEDWAAGVIDKDALNSIIADVKKDMRSALDGEFVTQKSVDEMNCIIRDLGNEIKQMKDKGINLTPGSELTKAIDDILDNQKFKDFCDGIAGKRSGKINLDLKGIVSLTNNYHGNVLTTQQSNRVIVDINERRINMRDLITVETRRPGIYIYYLCNNHRT